MKISMCSVNVCGLSSKLKYTILQDYMKQFDAICLTETKCDLISDNEINGFKSFIMPKNKKHKHGGIHGICVFIREHIAHNCTLIHKFVQLLISLLQNLFYGYT